MLENSIVPYNFKMPVNPMLIAKSAGLTYNYNFKHSFLNLYQKTKEITYNNYKSIVKFNTDCYHSVLFFFNENKKYKTYSFIALTLCGTYFLFFPKLNSKPKLLY